MSLIRSAFSFIFPPFTLGITGGGGGSSQSSSSTTNTTNIDKRLVVSSGIGISSDSSTVNVTDGGSVAAAIDLSKSSNETTYKSLQAIVGLADDVLHVESAQVAQTGGVIQTAASASNSAAALGDAFKSLAIGVAAVAALWVFRKG